MSEQLDLDQFEGHSLAPWEWSKDYRTIDGRETWSLMAREGYGILACDGLPNSPQEVHGVNHLLIAAAPQLLSALRAERAENTRLREALTAVLAGIAWSHDEFGGAYEPVEDFLGDDHDAMIKARAALAGEAGA